MFFFLLSSACKTPFQRVSLRTTPYALCLQWNNSLSLLVFLVFWFSLCSGLLFLSVFSRLLVLSVSHLFWDLFRTRYSRKRWVEGGVLVPRKERNSWFPWWRKEASLCFSNIGMVLLKEQRVMVVFLHSWKENFEHTEGMSMGHFTCYHIFLCQTHIFGRKKREGYAGQLFVFVECRENVVYI